MDLLSAFERTCPFPLDDFQRAAGDALAGDRSVLVCAPTGAGKTVVGEFGIWLALRRKEKAFYTTPLKALSNQKFGDFIARHGGPSVGLLTGDNSINGEAPVVVMTAEVLRNMIYEDSPTLRGLGVVVLDEVHYLRDQYRGATWEEILIHLPREVRIVALSATVSNASEFGAWLRTVRGPTDIVVEERRPVPIEHVYMAGTRMYPMFLREGNRLVSNPALRRLREPERHGGGARRGGSAPARGRVRIPDRVEVVERLREEGMLPAITFVFSRAGCEQAVDMCRAAGLTLTDADERERIREYIQMRTALLPEQDHGVLRFEEWADGLERGIAAHHAGLIPLFKETVEELFERALVKVVFATETLSLGINMPAKTVVIERLMKFTGERHELLTPADYTQLTGRAGRRGMDPVGYGVTLVQRDVHLDKITALAQAAAYPLVSSFRPSYNMAVNLLRYNTVAQATRLLNLSFGQFLADQSVSQHVGRIGRNERFLEGYRTHVTCDAGDFAEYWALARSIRAADRASQDEFRRDRTRIVRAAFESLRPGAVVRVRRGPRSGVAAVLEVRRGKGGEPHPVAMTADGKIVRLAIRDFREAPDVVSTMRLPQGDPRSGPFRDAVTRRLSSLRQEQHNGGASAPARARSQAEDLRAHPVWSCPDRDEHERWMQRIEELERETAILRKKVRARTETLARTFERVIAVLDRFGYLHEGSSTTSGHRLSRIYNESDLLVCEALDAGVFDGLQPAELAAVASTLVYETRIGVPRPTYPSDAVRRSVRALGRLYRRVHDAEETEHLEIVREPDPGFIEQIHAWATGSLLEDVLDLGEMTAGDFVRSAKQVVDLLRQLAEIEAPGEFRTACKAAATSVYRGVVAYSGAL
ncbi:MAG: DEAD/DEAH box helicase [Actinomycetota bacterium]